MSVPQRRTVTETRAERALPLPASLVAVAELLDAVRSELVAANRPASDAKLRIEEGTLVAAYVVPDEPKRVLKAGFE